MQWLGVLQQVEAAGSGAWDSVKAALAAHGIEADTAQLDAVIADAARRKALAEREARDVIGPISTGNLGE